MSQTMTWVNQIPGIRVKLFDKFRDRLADYHIYHCFGLSSEFVSLARCAKAQEVLFICSPVYWEPSELNAETKSWILRTSSELVHKTASVFRGFEPFRYIAPEQSLLDMADFILPNSKIEADLLSRVFHIDGTRVRVVPNGVEPSFMNSDSSEFEKLYQISDFILYVGRIEPRKNLIRLSKAAANLSMDLVLVGSAEANKDYLRKCLSISPGRIHFLGPINHDSSLLRSVYKAARVFALPSWFETPGLSAMEAAVAGCQVVVTDRGSAKEYFGDFVEYCDPSRVDSISNAIQRALARHSGTQLSAKMLADYSWERIGEKVAATYRELVAQYGYRYS